jgi:hypothetical protein
VSWKSPKLWIMFFSLAAVAFVGVVSTERKSPGPIASVHGRETDLDGGNNCSACHGGWFATMQEACLECHGRIGEQMEARTGLHGVLEQERVQHCAACHSEHHGEGFAMVNRASFAQAGIADPKDFDHQLLGWLMDGKHLEQECSECHEHADVKVLEAGTQRFGGLDSSCVTCHEDVHEGRMQVACASCHGQLEWTKLHSVGHERFLPLVGGHGDVDCRTCHVQGDRHSLEALGSAKKRPAPRDCAACHASPHVPELTAGTAAMSNMTEGQGCVVCHQAEHVAFREPGLAITAEQHLLTGYPLVAPHDDVACADCHDPQFETFEARYPGRGAEQCSACHADVHEGQFAEGVFAGRECTACHDRLAFAPHAFTTESHAVTVLPLDGKHLDVQCEECHVRPAPDASSGRELPRVFHGTVADCDGCHADAHAGFFDARAEALPEVEHGDCARCHDTQGFALVPESRFEHGRWTGFAVDGAHAQAECNVCHVARAEPDAAGRTFGRVDEGFGRFQGCVTCHADVHAGRFDAEGLPRVVQGRADCARCHATSSFRAPPWFDHGTWTGFALAGAHAETDCTGCHAPLAHADAHGRTWGSARGNACADCHIDVHEAQFASGGRTDCSRCHTSSADDFLRFDHDRDSRFPLGQQHRGVACDACHKPFALPNGDEVVRYKPLPTECADCHGVGEDVLLRRARPRGR